MLHRSRPVVVLVGVTLIAVLVLSLSACGGGKRKRNSSHSSNSGSTTSAQPYRDCEAAWNAGRAPLKKGDRGYSVALDRLDGKEDGTACAVRPTSRAVPTPVR